MELFGSTRSRVARDHALITPDTNVPSTPIGWEKTRAFVVIAPQMGAAFTQYLKRAQANMGEYKPGRRARLSSAPVL